MTLSEVEKLFERAVRFRRKVGSKESDREFSWSAKPLNSEVQRYSVAGIKPPEEVEDDLQSTFVWLWSLKDYVKKFLEAKGQPSKWVEAEIDADPHLAICADLANGAKHGELDRSRSGRFPRLGKLTYQIPQSALSSIRFGAAGVGLAVEKPTLVVLEMPVAANDGTYLGDALKYLDYALKAWERMIDRAERAV